MNSVNFKSVKSFTNNAITKAVIAAAFIVATLAPVAHAWEVDLSRRQSDFARVQNTNRLPASVSSEEQVGLVEKILEPASDISQDIVILNTPDGFVPEQVSVKKGAQYRLHVVNINPENKNTSFVFDAFSEHHNTFYGKQKVITVNPKADGVFTFNCPETGKQGKFVVISPERKPASR